MLDRALYAIGARKRWIIGSVIVGLLVGGTALHAGLRGPDLPSTSKMEAELEKTITEIDGLSIPTVDVAGHRKAMQALADTLSKFRANLDRGLPDKTEVAALRAQTDAALRALREWEKQGIDSWRENRNKYLQKVDSVRNTLRQFRVAFSNSIYSESNDTYFRRLLTDVESIFLWATVWGTLAFFGFMYLLFFVPPAEWLKPVSAIWLRLRGLTVLGFSLDLSQEKIQRDKIEIQSSLEIIQSMVRSHYRQAVQDTKLIDAFKKFVRLAIPKLGPPGDRLKDEEFRATLHVPYYLGDKDLFQIVNYVDANGDEIHQKPGAGRHFSIRFGIIGRAWREEKARYDPSVPVKPNDLVRMWGMTQIEGSSAAQGKKTFLAVRLFDESMEPLAILYMDAKKAHLFDEKKIDAPKDGIDATLNIRRAAKLEHEFNELAERVLLRVKLKSVRDYVRWQMEGRVTF